MGFEPVFTRWPPLRLARVCREHVSVVVVCPLVLREFNGAGYMREYDIERAARDARLGPIGGGTDEIMKEILGLSVGLG
jgi:alkylation response protein AidB-like acyl-CoA dehydrogenase